MMMRGCFFANNGTHIYALATQARCKSYLIKYKVNDNFDPIDTMIVHNGPTTGMRSSKSGNQIGIMTSDGWVKLINEHSHKFIY